MPNQVKPPTIGSPKPEGYVFGRPTKYEPRFCEMLIEDMAEGYSFEAFAGRVHVAISTLYEWLKAHHDFSEAYKAGEGDYRRFWEDVGRKVSTTGIGNSNAWKFNMQNRFKWTDRSDLTTEGEKLTGPVVYIPKEEDGK